MAEAGLHHTVEAALALPDEGVDPQGGQAVALDRDRTVPLALHELPEHLVAQQRELLLPVRRLAEAQETWLGLQRPEEVGERRPEVVPPIGAEAPARTDRQTGAHSEVCLSVAFASIRCSVPTAW